MINSVYDSLLGHLLTLRPTCLMTYPLESSLELTYVSEVHFVRQQPTEPSEFDFATWVHFRHFVTCQSDLSDLSECVVFLMYSHYEARSIPAAGGNNLKKVGIYR